MNYVFFIIDPSSENRSAYVKNWHNDNMDRMHAPLFNVDCSTFEGFSLLEEMIGTAQGYKKNPQTKIGYFEKANGGSILLNNIDSLPEEVLIKLKDYVNTGKIMKFGSNFIKKIDVQFCLGLKESCEVTKALFPNHHVINLQRVPHE